MCKGAAAPGVWLWLSASHCRQQQAGERWSDLGKLFLNPQLRQNFKTTSCTGWLLYQSPLVWHTALGVFLVLPVTSLLSLLPAVTWDAMASSSDSDDDGFMAVDAEDAVVEGTMEQEDEPHAELEVEEPRPSSRSMLELPEEVLEYILSFLSPYQEHKTAALVCKQWYRLIKGTSDGSNFFNCGVWNPALFYLCLLFSPQTLKSDFCEIPEKS